MKDKGAFAILLELPAGKEVTATTKGTKQTDVHLFVYDADKKEVGKDTSPGPKMRSEVHAEVSRQVQVVGPQLWWDEHRDLRGEAGQVTARIARAARP